MLRNLLATIAKTLDAASIPYMVIGGQALLLHGETRFTEDIDITLGLAPDEFEWLLPVAQDLGLTILTEDPTSFVRDTYVLPCADAQNGVPIDFVFSVNPYERSAIDRAKVELLDNTPVRFATAEDIVIHKLFAGRPRDLEDIRSILLKQERLDTKYIRHWLPQFEEITNRSLMEDFDRLLFDDSK